MNDIYGIKNNKNKYYGDEKKKPFIFKSKSMNSLCVYCGEVADTREHLPTKGFFEDIENMDFQILPACLACNNKFSRHEQYLIHYLEYLKKYLLCDYEISEVTAKKLQMNPSLKQKIESEFELLSDGKVQVTYDYESIEIVLKKLAIGHIAYEMSDIFMEEPEHFNYKFIYDASEEELDKFNSIVVSDVIPEVGSRLSESIILGSDGQIVYPWRVLNDREYRYMTFTNKVYSGVRLVIHELLICEVLWSS